MFTGIIEAVGEVKGVRGNDKGISLQIPIPESFDDIKIGDSISVSGVCLTAKVINGGTFSADVSSETISRTTFGRIKPGGRVNLERAMRLSDRLGGHIVSGHIDGTSKLKERRDKGESVRLSFSLEKELLRYVINKGSIAIDGISLTVNEVGDGTFTVNIIPHTAQNTTILYKKAGDEVNIEVDIIGKYVEKLLGKGKEGKIDRSFLSEHGFL
ncbi:MAG: riboflavin synthase [Deltaproteobacteria bacterium]|nr:riboflavin synthase [Deltaproteobacteria bacterium]